MKVTLGQIRKIIREELRASRKKRVDEELTKLRGVQAQLLERRNGAGQNLKAHTQSLRLI